MHPLAKIKYISSLPAPILSPPMQKLPPIFVFEHSGEVFASEFVIWIAYTAKNGEKNLSFSLN